MPYTAEVSRQNPSCFLFLVDQSGSMSDPFGGGGLKKKADGVADAINRLLQNLVIRCAKAEGVRDYYHVGVLSYGHQSGPALGGALAGQELVPVSQVALHPARIEERTKKVDDGAGGLIEQNVKFPVWLDPVARGGTPMCRALQQADSIVGGWLDRYPDCFPPVIIHLTDGESTDGDPLPYMKQLTARSSSDGNVLLFNYHISSHPAPPVAFPGRPDDLPDQYARTLYMAASELTPFMREIAGEHGYELAPGAKGFTFNADLVLVIQALDIGTRPGNLR
ncbi:MAG: vWA domain-containing protein [Bacillota bacterium]